jgi:hypothetical protein
MFHISQWVKLPAGASGSSTMSTRLLASLGTPSIVSVGLTSLPSQVKRSGMFPPSLKSGLLSFIACSDGVFALPVLVIRVSASIRIGSRVFIKPRIPTIARFFRRPSDKHLSPKGFKLDSGCSARALFRLPPTLLPSAKTAFRATRELPQETHALGVPEAVDAAALGNKKARLAGRAFLLYRDYGAPE